MPARVIVIAVDRLGAAWLGPYGNSWIPTPALNRLAARSLLCDFVLANGVSLHAAYQSWWSGLPAFCTAVSSWPTLPQLAAEGGGKSLLITDSQELTEHPLAQGFSEGELLRSLPPEQSAERVEETQVAQLFQMAGDTIRRNRETSLVWIHASAINNIWDAPYSLRESFAGDDDPSPPTATAPAQRQLVKGHDPDELLGIVQSYAAEVAAFDRSLDRLLRTIESTSSDDTTIVFTSSRGYAIGEHLAVGAAGDQLYGEVLHVPLIVRFPHDRHRLARLSSLHQPTELYATLARLFDPHAETGWGIDLQQCVAGNSLRLWAIACGENEMALRTPAWFSRRSLRHGELRCEMFAKPDDRFEVNEISSRAARELMLFQECLQSLPKHFTQTTPAEFVLPNELTAAAR